MALRVVAALAGIVSAVVHLTRYCDGMRNTDVGVPFMINAVVGVVIAGLLVLWDHWVPAFLALGFGVSTLGAFILSTTVGLMGVHEQWVGGYVWTAAISEV